MRSEIAQVLVLLPVLLLMLLRVLMLVMLLLQKRAVPWSNNQGPHLTLNSEV